ncbi:hypothetical protein OKW50_006476 [Paraburkholderia youngii]|uniref:Glycosyltransferase n=1 Tax=Paraburkholderia youngii TaxID=2782701 RepID=A0A7W8LCY4_9BURK|nr:glycosyltransferase family 4 protein [Paraburkholderia youngii]MBB5403359.1 hypothetical protein [Paraburkholderia youngii]
MNALFLSHVRDAKSSNGGMVYSNQILSQLRRVCARVDVLYVYDDLPKWRKLRIAFSFLRSLFGPLPAKVLYFDRPSAHRALSRLTASVTPDIVVFDHLETVVYLRNQIGANAILIQHNDEATLYEDRLKKISNPITSAMLKFECLKLRRFQERANALIRNHVFISPDELAKDAALEPFGNRFCMLPAFDYMPAERIAPSATDKPIHLAFLGNMKWWPNQDAIEWLLSRIIPHIDENKVIFHLMGAGSEADRYQRKNVIGHGFVDQSSEIWNKSNVFLSPIVSGAGMNVKVAESIYNRRSVISTSKGVRGIPLVKDPSVIVSDSESEWIALLNDRNRLAQLDRKAVLAENSDIFDRNSSFDKFKSFLEKCK